MNKSTVEKTSTTRKKTGGRVKGTPNKSTEFLFNLCNEKKFDPVEFLIMVAQNDWKALGYENGQVEKQGFQGVMYFEDRITMDHRVDAAKSLVGYMYPKRKAIEHTTSDENSNVIFMAYDPKKLKLSESKAE